MGLGNTRLKVYQSMGCTATTYVVASCGSKMQAFSRSIVGGATISRYISGTKVTLTSLLHTT